MNRMVFIALVFIPATIFSFTGTNISSEVSEIDGKKLQWKNGSYDYFVMFKSLIANDIRVQCLDVEENDSLGCDWGNNPEGDTCLSSSTFTLTYDHVPDDAYVEAAYLVWSGSVSLDKTVEPVDNTAEFSFLSKDGKVSIDKVITAPRQGVPGTDDNNAQQDFTFEGFVVENSGTVYGAHYTYRVDITDTIKEIQKLGRDAGNIDDGISLLGDYTIGGTVCSDDPAYISKVSGYNTYSSTFIGGWSIILIYKAFGIYPKVINIYNGFSFNSFMEHKIPVSGFELPANPQIKLTFHTLEGDPGISIANGTQCGEEGTFSSPCPPEGLSVSGESSAENGSIVLYNDCNPQMFKDMLGTTFNYTETYNSISSIFIFDAYYPDCIGGNPNLPDADTLEYTMDVDTFLINSSNYSTFHNNFLAGDTSMFLNIGTNSDAVYSNFLIVGIDSKSTRYDIPPNAFSPMGREKIYCGCSDEIDKVCFDSPFYFALKIQNWGNDTAREITIQDTLPDNVDYVSGTTEMCKDWDYLYKCTNWVEIKDGTEGSFPLEEPYMIADTLEKSDPEKIESADTIMIRFKVQPVEGIKDNAVIENTAIISDSEGESYRTNSSVPLRLKSGSCPSKVECNDPDLNECGGVVENSDDENNDDSISDTEKTDDTEEQRNDSDQFVSEKDDNSTDQGSYLDGEYNDSSGCSCSVLDLL